MNFTGLIIGICAFLIIGVFHPIVIKSEYYFGSKCWPFFLIGGIIFVIISLFIKNNIISCIFAVIAFSAFWGIGELKEQEKRVAKGWFPANPKRKK